MASLMGSIIRRATRKEGEPYNCLTFPTHEANQTEMAKANANFYGWRGPGIKTWETKYRPLPNNFTLLNPQLGPNQIPIDVEFDFILSQNKFAHFPIAYQLSQNLHLPLISLEHCLPVNYSQPQLDQLKAMRGDINVFISEFSREKWGWGEDEADVVHHGIDTKMFCPNDRVQRENRILTVCNDFIGRGHLLGYNIWQNVTKGLNTKVVGDTKGLSLPAKSCYDLIREYQSSSIYFNTSIISPIPTSLMEAMSCGCAILTTATAMIPEVIKDGVNGFITNDEKEMRQRLNFLLVNPDKARELGQAARQTIIDRFPLNNFVNNWNKIFDRAANTVFTGVNL